MGSSFYRAAKDTKIAIHGKKELNGYTQEGLHIGINMHITDMKKALGSVRRLCEAGNRDMFEEEASYVENKCTNVNIALVIKALTR